MSWPALRRSAWAIPTFLTIGSGSALLVALAADGIWDVLAWALLSVPLVIVGWALLTKKPSAGHSANAAGDSELRD